MRNTFTTTVALLTMFCAAVFAQQKGTFKDARDKKKYKTVKIGTLNWLAENLNYTNKSYPAEENKCYDNKPANCTKYGRLYSWETAMKACPKGWHLPSEVEWKHLTANTSGEKSLKTKNGWEDKNKKTDNGTDDYGFSALPGGFFFYDINKGNNAFSRPGEYGAWWTSSKGEGFMIGQGSKGHILRSVRCVDDESFLKLKAEIEIIEKEEVEKREGAEKEKVTFTDSRDKKNYKTIKIGKQIWFAENLDYADKNSKCYDNKPENCKKYGRLYNWETAKKSCPRGWHLPSDAEWTQLAEFSGGKGIRGKEGTVGTKLKAWSGWKDYEGKSGGSDVFGFSALPGGYSNSGSDFNFIGNYGLWWSASEYDIDRAYNRLMRYNDEIVYWDLNNKECLRSVRCVKDF